MRLPKLFGLGLMCAWSLAACSEDSTGVASHAPGASVATDPRAQGAVAGSSAPTRGTPPAAGNGASANPPGSSAPPSNPPGAAGGGSPAAPPTPPTAGVGSDPMVPTAPPIAGSGTDYSKKEHWLCRPDIQGDACAVDLSTTIVAADGTLTMEPFTANPDAPIDCFYVYPTISRDTTPNSDLTAGPEERGVVAAQFARFGSQCRLFAPMYRQVTLTTLTASLGGGSSGMMPDQMLGLRDIESAWQHYLDNDNKGRGVVFVGHSQGSGVLTRLLVQHLDKNPADPRFIAALLIGTRVQVPLDADVGATFKNLPLCTSDEQLGCIVTYASFRSTVPPPANSPFAGASTTTRGACTNPAKLAGGPAELHAYMSSRGGGLGSAMAAPWVTPEKPITTPYVSVPGLLTGGCVSTENGVYFEIKVNGDPADPRVDDIVGDIVMNGMPSPSWGLHLIDMNVAMGDMVKLVGDKGKLHVAKVGP